MGSPRLALDGTDENPESSLSYRQQSHSTLFRLCKDPVYSLDKKRVYSIDEDPVYRLDKDPVEEEDPPTTRQTLKESEKQAAHG